MTRSLLASLLLALAACGGAAPAAPAAPAAEPPAVPESPAAASSCDPLRVTIGPGATDRAAVEAAIAVCPDGSEVTVALDGDISYDDLVVAMDVMAAHRHSVALDAPALPGLTPQSVLPGAVSPSDPVLKRAPVVQISTAAVTVRAGDTLHNLAARPELDDAGARKLYDTLVALRTADPALTGVLVLQADRTTRSPTLQRTVASARAAGFTNVLFAVKNR